MAVSPFLLLLLLGLFPSKSEQLSCISDSGKNVDWFIAYKIPKKIDNPIQDGYGYAYMDAQTQGFRVSKFSANDKSSSMGATLQQVYENAEKQKDSLAYVFYNDANPDGKEFFTYAHSKGDIAFDNDSGFWLVHSVPKYPGYVAEGYEYPHSGTYYGQMFFCVTFNASQFDAIGLQMRYNGPHIHDSNFPASMTEKFPNVYALLQEDFISDPPYNHSQRLVSSAGKKLTHFAKTKDFNADLYYMFVAPSLKTNLLAETWQHGSGKIGPSCQGYTVETIIKLSVKTSSSTFNFANYKDHSKFVVSKSSDLPYVCIGDINRMTTQYERGGGTLCTEDAYIWKIFHDLVVDTISCEGNYVHV
eukprot:gene11019-12183_t